MSSRYEHFNEIVFEAYCKVCIDHAVNKGKKEKARRAKVEIAFSSLPEKKLLSIAADEPDMTDKLDQTIQPIQFHVHDYEINVSDPRLGQALRYLTPKDRGIILLYYFLGMSDAEVGEIFEISRSTVQRRRVAAQRKLKAYIGRIE